MKLKPFQMPQSVKVEETNGINYAKFVIGPFERGFGTTMGNVFRRILLSSIHGVAVTKVKFDQAYHEFSTLDGVKENVTDIILNIKKIRFNMDEEDDDKTVTLNIKGPKEVTAGDITAPAGIEIVNKDLYLFTITKNVTVKIEMIYGYSLSSRVLINQCKGWTNHVVGYCQNLAKRFNESGFAGTHASVEAYYTIWTYGLNDFSSGII